MDKKTKNKNMNKRKISYELLRHMMPLYLCCGLAGQDGQDLEVGCTDKFKWPRCYMSVHRIIITFFNADRINAYDREAQSRRTEYSLETHYTAQRQV
jgi:hypothetical protein